MEEIIDSVERDIEKLQEEFVKRLNEIGVYDIKDIHVAISCSKETKKYGWILKG